MRRLVHAMLIMALTMLFGDTPRDQRPALIGPTSSLQFEFTASIILKVRKSE